MLPHLQLVPSIQLSAIVMLTLIEHPLLIFEIDLPLEQPLSFYGEQLRELGDDLIFFLCYPPSILELNPPI